MDQRIELIESSRVNEEIDPLPGRDSEMIVTLWTDLEVALDLLAVDDAPAVIALDPEALWNRHLPGIGTLRPG